MRVLDGLRTRLIGLVLFAVLPLYLVAFVVLVDGEREQLSLQVAASAGQASIASDRLRNLLSITSSLSAVVSPVNNSAGCGANFPPLRSLARLDSRILVTADGRRCNLIPGTDDTWLTPAVLDAVRASQQRGVEVGITNDGDPTGRLVLGSEARQIPGALLVVRASRAETDRLLDPGAGAHAGPLFEGFAIIDGDHPIIERHAEAIRPDWWPAGGAITADAAPRTLTKLPQQGGGRATYFAEPVEGRPQLQIVGLAARSLLTSGIWPIWFPIVPMGVLLLVLMGLSVWLVERSVVRWIIYLTRIATLHSRGRHSIRAPALKNAPKELSALADALNSMADDAMARSASLEKSAAEASALLLELHHRVKNILQIITSLLSLVRQDTTGAGREEIRLVEDFVHAMAAAYRLAYNSGDLTGMVAQDLTRIVVETIGALAGAKPAQIDLKIGDAPIWLDIDTAISLSLYLAVTLPPYVSALPDEPGTAVGIDLTPEGASLRLSIRGSATDHDAAASMLRTRLRKAYMRQLRAREDGPALVIPLDDVKHAHRLAEASTSEVHEPSTRIDQRVLAGCFERAAAEIGLMLSGQDGDLTYRWVAGASHFGDFDTAIAGRGDGDLFPSATAAALMTLKEDVLADGEPRNMEFQLSTTDRERWFQVRAWPLQNALSQTTGILTTYQEITRFREAETRLDLLLHEMSHRSKNVLAITEAMARQTLAHANSLDDFGRRFSSRLHSLASSHDLLTRGYWKGGLMSELVRAELAQYLDGEAPQASADGPDLMLTATALPYLGLALHELSSNAAKHGALSVAAGRVALSWGFEMGTEPHQRFWLRWIEQGGPPVAVPTRRGFGTELTERILARALRGKVTLEYAPSGLIWRADVPADALIETMH